MRTFYILKKCWRCKINIFKNYDTGRENFYRYAQETNWESLSQNMSKVFVIIIKPVTVFKYKCNCSYINTMQVFFLQFWILWLVNNAKSLFWKLCKQLIGIKIYLLLRFLCNYHKKKNEYQFYFYFPIFLLSFKFLAKKKMIKNFVNASNIYLKIRSVLP